MPRNRSNSVLSCVIIFRLILSIFAVLGTVNASSSASESLSSDAIWTRTDSPYDLTGPLTVENGATLSIEPGVTVNLNSYTLQVNGILNAVGSNTDKIIFNDGNIAFRLPVLDGITKAV